MLTKYNMTVQDRNTIKSVPSAATPMANQLKLPTDYSREPEVCTDGLVSKLADHLKGSTVSKDLQDVYDLFPKLLTYPWCTNVEGVSGMFIERLMHVYEECSCMGPVCEHPSAMAKIATTDTKALLYAIAKNDVVLATVITNYTLDEILKHIKELFDSYDNEKFVANYPDVEHRRNKFDAFIEGIAEAENAVKSDVKSNSLFGVNSSMSGR